MWAPIVSALIPIMVPIILDLMKRYLPVPSSAIAAIGAPALGAAANSVIAMLTSPDGVTVAAAGQGVLLGLAGVGVREAYNQNVTQRMQQPK
jgi:hypothetical protein